MIQKPLHELTDAEYRALPYESYSSIKHLLDSPQVFKYFKENPFKGSDSTLLGTTIHHYLQGNKHLVAFNAVDKRKKEEYAEFETLFREVAGEEGIIVPKSFEEKVSCIMKNFNDNPGAIRILNGCEIEIPFLLTFNDVTLKGKVDGFRKDTIAEIKTTSMAQDLDSFRKEALFRDYDLQAFLYTLGLNASNHYFIVCGTTPPYTVNIYKTSERFLESGKRKAEIVTDRYKRHIINNEPFNEKDNIEEL